MYEYMYVCVALTVDMEYPQACLVHIQATEGVYQRVQIIDAESHLGT